MDAPDSAFPAFPPASPAPAVPPSRGFGVALFAVVALLVATALTPMLLGFFQGPPCRGCPGQGNHAWRAFPLPVFAAVCAAAWAWLLHPGPGAGRYGTGRGVVVAFGAYVSFALVASVYVQAVMAPYLGAGDRFELALLMGIAFIYTPFPWAVLAAGAGTGSVPLASARRRGRRALDFLWPPLRRVALALVQDLRALDARARSPQFVPVLRVGVSSALLLAGTCIGFVVLRAGPASTGDFGGLSVLQFPAAGALIVGALGWLLGRVAVARLPLASRGLLLVAAVAAGLVGAAVFVGRVA